MYRSRRTGKSSASITDLNPGRRTIDAARQLRYHRHCAPLNRLRYKPVRVELLPSNSDKDRSRNTGTRIVGDIERFDVESPGSGHRIYLLCHIIQLQITLPAFGDRQKLKFVGLVRRLHSSATFLTASLESLTRQVVSCATRAPGEGFCNET